MILPTVLHDIWFLKKKNVKKLKWCRCVDLTYFWPSHSFKMAANSNYFNDNFSVFFTSSPKFLYFFIYIFFLRDFIKSDNFSSMTLSSKMNNNRDIKFIWYHKLSYKFCISVIIHFRRKCHRRKVVRFDETS